MYVSYGKWGTVSGQENCAWFVLCNHPDIMKSVGWSWAVARSRSSTRQSLNINTQSHIWNKVNQRQAGTTHHLYETTYIACRCINSFTHCSLPLKRNFLVRTYNIDGTASTIKLACFGKEKVHFYAAKICKVKQLLREVHWVRYQFYHDGTHMMHSRSTYQKRIAQAIVENYRHQYRVATLGDTQRIDWIGHHTM